MKILNPSFRLSEFYKKVQERSLLILDYDGTLAPLVVDRKQAYPYPGVKARLDTLITLAKTRLVIVSGRYLVDLEQILKKAEFPCVELWGSHGLERRLVNGNLIQAEIEPALLEGIEKGKNFCQICLGTTDIRFEVKPYSVALHWRGMEESMKLQAIKHIEPMWKEICSVYDVEIHYFDNGMELRPRKRNKGEVVAELLKESTAEAAMAYLGDDATDEEAFAVLGERGLKVLVRKELHPTLADIYLIPPEELLAFLDHWIDISR